MRFQSLLAAVAIGAVIATLGGCISTVPGSQTARPAPKASTAPASPTAAVSSVTIASSNPPAVQSQLDEYYLRAQASGELKVTHYGLFQEYLPLVRAFQERFPGTAVEPVGLRAA